PAVGARSPPRKRSRACAGVRSATSTPRHYAREPRQSAFDFERVRPEAESVPDPPDVALADQALQALPYLLIGQAGAVHQLPQADGAVLDGRSGDRLVHVDVDVGQRL